MYSPTFAALTFQPSRSVELSKSPLQRLKTFIQDDLLSQGVDRLTTPVCSRLRPIRSPPSRTASPIRGHSGTLAQATARSQYRDQCGTHRVRVAFARRSDGGCAHPSKRSGVTARLPRRPAF